MVRGECDGEGKSRLEIQSQATYGNLCEAIAERLSLAASSLQIYKDKDFTQRITATGSASLKKAGISDGTQLFIKNSDAKVPAAVPHKAPEAKSSGEDTKKEEKKAVKKDVKKEIKKDAKKDGKKDAKKDGKKDGKKDA